MERATLESVLATHELARRQHKRRDCESECRALVELARHLPTSPDGFLQEVCDVALLLCRAHSSGVSLLEREQGKAVFRWHAVAGRYAPHVWGTMLRDASPCGTVVDCGALQLMRYPGRHFSALRSIGPEVVEALLAPFVAQGRVAGTVWLLSHDESVSFAASDAAALETIAAFVGPVYELLREVTAVTAPEGLVR